MSSRKYKTINNLGFTLLEVLISLGIIAIIAGLGLFLSFDFYKSYMFHYEEDLVTSILRKARSQSLANINQKKHGVHFETDQYVIFEAPYLAGNANNIVFNSSAAIGHSTGATTEIIFDQLSGQAQDNSSAPCDEASGNCKIHLSYNSQNIYIYVNQEGRIYEK